MSPDEIDRQEWHVITCEYPPTIGGVSDHTHILAAALGSAQQTHVWCPSATGTAPTAESPGVVIHRDLGRFSPADLYRVGRLLNQRPTPRRLFVQWVPHGFGYRALNLFFAGWIAARGLLRGDDVQLMIHEPFLPLSWHPLRLSMALIQRAMLLIMGLGVRRVWLSTPTWRARVRPYFSRDTRIEWLPVPVPRLVASRNLEIPGSNRPLTIGHFGTHSPLVIPLVAAALDQLLTRTNARLLLIGSGSEEFRCSYLESRSGVGTRVIATGTLTADGLAARLAECDVMIQPYPDGVTARRTSTITLLALGKVVVTNTGHLTEPFWTEADAVCLVAGPDGTAIGAAAAALVEDRAGCERLGRRARELHDRWFDRRHAVAVLQGAA